MSDDRLRSLMEQPSEPCIDIEDYDSQSMPIFDIYDQQDKPNQTEHHTKMLEFVLRQSNDIAETVKESEKSKTWWRRIIMIVLLSLLCITVLFIGALVWLYLCREIDLPMALLVGLFSTVIAQIISLLILFIKFITNVETLKMHKVVTYKLLDYLSKNIR